MPGRIDVHCHLLPCIDDGCADYDDSLACARMMVAEGYTHAFCTPHIWPSLPHNTAPNIALRTEEFQAQLHDAGVPLTVFPGGELNLRPDILKTPPDQIVTYGLNRRFCLFDLWVDSLPSFFDPAVKRLQSLGLTVIVAHPERMRAVQDDPTIVEHFLELGLLLQGNLQCFSDPPESSTRRTAERLLREQRYFLLGSDTHTVDTLPIRLSGLHNAIKLAGEDAATELTIKNPAKLL